MALPSSILRTSGRSHQHEGGECQHDISTQPCPRRSEPYETAPERPIWAYPSSGSAAGYGRPCRASVNTCNTPRALRVTRHSTDLGRTSLGPRWRSTSARTPFRPRTGTRPPTVASSAMCVPAVAACATGSGACASSGGCRTARWCSRPTGGHRASASIRSRRSPSTTICPARPCCRSARPAATSPVGSVRTGTSRSRRR